MRKFPIPAAGAAIALAGLLALAGCRSDAQGETPLAEKGGKALAPAPVEVASVVRKDVPLEIRSFGRVEPFSTIEVKCQVGGELTEVLFREGDEVKRGQHIFTIDPRSYEAALHQAEGALERDEAQLKNAELEAKRYQDLLAANYVSRDICDQAVATAEALGGTVRADGAAVENARVQLGYCTILSPIDGRIGKLLVHRGNVVKANADTPLVTITQVRPIYVTFSVPEKELPEIRRRQAEGPLQVEAFLPAEGDRAVPGLLTFINNTVDVTTGMILLRGTFENADGVLWPGLYVNVRLGLSTLPGALTVPSQAVQIGQQGTFVFVVKEDSTVDMRPVTVRAACGGESVIDRGVAEGEMVVTLGHIRLFPGARVERKGPRGMGAGGKMARE